MASHALQKPIRLHANVRGGGISLHRHITSSSHDGPGPSVCVASQPRIPLAEISLALADSRGEAIRRRRDREYDESFDAINHLDSTIASEQRHHRRSSRKASQLSPFCQGLMRLGADHSILNASSAGVLPVAHIRTSPQCNFSASSPRVREDGTLSLPRAPNANKSGQADPFEASGSFDASFTTDDTPDLDHTSDDGSSCDCSPHALRRVPLHSTPARARVVRHSLSPSSLLAGDEDDIVQAPDENTPSPVTRRRVLKEVKRGLIKPSLSPIPDVEQLARREAVCLTSL